MQKSLPGGRVVYVEDYSCVVDPVQGRGGIYIGNLEAAQNPTTLSRNGIKAVLTACKGVEITHPKSKIPFYLQISADDHSDFDISRYFPKAVNFISTALQTTNIMVHCLAGVSRSVCLVIAYLIGYKSMTYNEGFNLIKSRRQTIHPNEGFIKQLKGYEKSLSISKNKFIYLPQEDHNNKTEINQMKGICSKVQIALINQDRSLKSFKENQQKSFSPEKCEKTPKFFEIYGFEKGQRPKSQLHKDEKLTKYSYYCSHDDQVHKASPPNNYDRKQISRYQQAQKTNKQFIGRYSKPKKTIDSPNMRQSTIMSNYSIKNISQLEQFKVPNFNKDAFSFYAEEQNKTPKFRNPDNEQSSKFGFGTKKLAASRTQNQRIKYSRISTLINPEKSNQDQPKASKLEPRQNDRLLIRKTNFISPQDLAKELDAKINAMKQKYSNSTQMILNQSRRKLDQKNSRDENDFVGETTFKKKLSENYKDNYGKRYGDTPSAQKYPELGLRTLNSLQ